MIDRKRLVQTLVGVYGFYDKELSEFAIRVWMDALGDIEPALIDAAFDQHLKNVDAGRFCPKPADILRQLRGDANDQALIAWGEVLAAARQGGARFDGAAQRAIDSLGGMHVLRMADESQNTFLQRQFVDAFKAYTNRDKALDMAILAHDNIKRIGS